MKIPLDDKHLPTRNRFLDDIVVLSGGYGTEEIVFGDVSTGPSNDLEVGTHLAREMVTKYGMSPDIGPLTTNPAPKVVFGNAAPGVSSPALQARIDGEVEHSNERISHQSSCIIK